MLAAFGVTLLFAIPAWARAAGIAGYSGKTVGKICNDCHSGGTAPTVSLIGPDTLLPGAVGDYTLRVETAAARAGADIAATDGVELAPGTNLKAQNLNEVSHSAPTAPTGGAVEFLFKVTAPQTTGTIMLYAAGNAVDNSGNNGGDLAASTIKAVTVAAAPVITTDAGVSPATDGGDLPAVAVADGGGAVATKSGGDGGTKPFSAGNDEPFDPTFAETGLSCSVGQPGRTPSPFEPLVLTLMGVALLVIGARWGRRREEQ